MGERQLDTAASGAIVPDLARHAQIRDDLKAAGTTIAALARELGVAQSTVTIVSQGHRRSHRIQAAIAGKLGCDVRELFPDRYGEDDMNGT